ncbi:MAG: M56 family metallopeptidase, partial [Nonlabens sp.]
NPPVDVTYDWNSILGCLYIIGVLASLLIYVRKATAILIILKEARIKLIDKRHIYISDRPQLAFSFLGKIVISSQIPERDYDKIIEHETIHCRQHHGWDLNWFELMRVLFWFHPVAYLAQKQAQIIHEFIVDEKLASHKSTYLKGLLNNAFQCDLSTIVNTYYNPSQLKQRIIMISKTKSTRTSYRKLLLLIPIVTLSLFYTACTEEPEINDAGLEQPYAGETVNINGHDLPTLRSFTYGKKDFFKGMTDEEIFLLKKQDNKFIQGFADGFESIRSSSDGDNNDQVTANMNNAMLEYLRIFRQLSNNGSTLAVDTDNDNSLVLIKESPFTDPTYSGIPLFKQKEMTTGEYNEYVDSVINSINKNPYSIEKIVEEIEIEEIPANEGSTQTDLYDSTIEEQYAVPFVIVEKTPSYEGCSGSNQEIKKCTQEGITKFINENFNIDVAPAATGQVKINVRFKINKIGQVTDIKAVSNNLKLQQEAARVVSQLPNFSPGLQRGKPIDVIYSLPVIFEVNR